ncbi:STAS domain-containing protein [Candidatus Margulisiibacteriota bacterium]
MNIYIITISMVLFNEKEEVLYIMSLNLQIKVREEESVPVLDLIGEIDVYTYPQLNEVINKVINDNNYNIIINLEKVKYIDSTGLGVLASSANKVAPQNGILHIICTQPQIKKIFIVSGLLEKNFKLYDNEAEAITAVA